MPKMPIQKLAIRAQVSYRTPGFLLTVVLAATLAGCQTAVAPGEGINGVSFKAGENTIGEVCQVVSAIPDTDLLQEISAYHVFCGQWEQPSAVIYRTTDHGGHPGTGEPELVAGAPWTALSIASRRRADEHPGWRVPRLPWTGTFRLGGWPNQALVTPARRQSLLRR